MKLTYSQLPDDPISIYAALVNPPVAAMWDSITTRRAAVILSAARVSPPEFTSYAKPYDKLTPAQQDKVAIGFAVVLFQSKLDKLDDLKKQQLREVA